MIDILSYDCTLLCFSFLCLGEGNPLNVRSRLVHSFDIRVVTLVKEIR